MWKLWRTIRHDLEKKAEWCYESTSPQTLLKVLATDGTAAMVLYRLMQASRERGLVPLEMVFNKLNTVFCSCIIGRGAAFGDGLVMIHSQGIVVNGRVKAGKNLHIEHQVTIGAERRQCPVIGDDVFIGAGAKIIGSVTIGDGARIGANAVVVHDVAPHTTVVGIPAGPVQRRTSLPPPPAPSSPPSPPPPPSPAQAGEGGGEGKVIPVHLRAPLAPAEGERGVGG